MTNDEKIQLDGAFKEVARKQGDVGKLAEEGAVKTHSNTSQDDWDDYFRRHKAARDALDAAQDALEETYRQIMERRS